ncbi:MAG: hypothetical protein AAFY65_04285 [Pseudomonadota bacterium]
MQFEKLLTKTAMRLARAGLGIRADAPAPAPAPAPSAPLKGSGSWANDWVGARSAMNRAKSLASLGKKRKSKSVTHTKPAVVPVPEDDLIPEGAIQVKPLLSIQQLKMHNWILDRLEAEAPTCTLHAGVALSAFLNCDTAYPGNDPLAGLTVDLLVVDENGCPCVAIVRENEADPAGHLRLCEALLDGEVPVVDLPSRPSLSTLWSAIAANLPRL